MAPRSCALGKRLTELLGCTSLVHLEEARPANRPSTTIEIYVMTHSLSVESADKLLCAQAKGFRCVRSLAVVNYACSNEVAHGARAWRDGKAS